MSKTVIYARKSSESEDRQILSIESQVKELQTHASREDLGIVKVFAESKSAKAPGRPIFNQLLSMIQSGKIDSILCWKLDRLVRNPVDGGSVIWAMEEQKLQCIHTPQRNFMNNSNDKFWMQLEFGMAKKYVDDLSDNVKRGMKTKLEHGWFPHLAPLGYLNNVLEKVIIKDPDRFPIIRKMWKMMVIGNYTPPEILELATNKWGLRTRQHRKKGGNTLTRSTIYKIFSNPFYYGAILRAGQLYEGQHEPMITRSEFERVQTLLGRNESRRPQKHHFAFTGLIKCGECGASITAEHKKNRYGSKYIYYHCTKRKKNVPCNQRVIELTDLENQILEFLSSISISRHYREWSSEILEVLRKDDQEKDEVVIKTLKRQHENYKNQLASLLNLKLKELVTDEEFVEKKREIEIGLGNVKGRLDGIQSGNSDIYRSCEETFRFVEKAQDIFIRGGVEDKRAVLSCVGSNLLLQNRKLLIHEHKPLEIIREGLKSSSAKNARFESQICSEPWHKKKNAIKGDLLWSSTVDDVRKWFIKNRQHSSWFYPLRMLDYTKKN